MLSSFIETWSLGERELLGKVLLGVTGKAPPALEANAGLAEEFQGVQHPEEHLGPHQRHSALIPTHGGLYHTQKRRKDFQPPQELLAGG